MLTIFLLNILKLLSIHRLVSQTDIEGVCIITRIAIVYCSELTLTHDVSSIVLCFFESDNPATTHRRHKLLHAVENRLERYVTEFPDETSFRQLENNYF